MELIIKTEDDMLRLGQSLAQVLDNRDVICLHGVLGAGKTTLVRGVARGKGYQGRVTSPTFTLMNIYNAAEPIYHFDFYRLEGGDLTDLGLDDYVGKDGICLIEWPEIGAEALPQEAMHIYIRLSDDDYDRERLVSIEPGGRDNCRKLKELERIVHSGR